MKPGGSGRLPDPFSIDLQHDRRVTMNIKRISLLALALGFWTLGWVAVSDAASKDIPRITKEELKDQLGAADVVLLDVRAGKDWSSSELKIKGAVRADPKDFDSWDSKYPKEKKIVLYCA
jgi:hypothetical protein